MIFDSSCKKCRTAMKEGPRLIGAFANLPYTITGYRCDECGHWNDLKKRKGYKQWSGSHQNDPQS